MKWGWAEGKCEGRDSWESSSVLLSVREYPYIGEAGMDRESRPSQRSNSKAKIPGRGSEKDPRSKARPQKVRITVTGCQQ